MLYLDKPERRNIVLLRFSNFIGTRPVEIDYAQNIRQQE